ncbi:hypothetical protein V7034_18430, partial [Priestia megaterium]|uniref:hypothetical protein n=1 Tax=Priestia megaterium TaxID=1404 RepID=UPI002FFE4A72
LVELKRFSLPSRFWGTDDKVIGSYKKVNRIRLFVYDYALICVTNVNAIKEFIFISFERPVNT